LVFFSEFINDKVNLVGVEPAGYGIDTGKHGAPLSHGRTGIYFGMKSRLMQNQEGQIEKSWSISAGLDFPSVGPEHSWLDSIKRAKYVSITDIEALEAFQILSKKEGIIPALESAHALAYALKIMHLYPKKEQVFIVNLSGRGDKDIFTVRSILQKENKKI